MRQYTSSLLTVAALLVQLPLVATAQQPCQRMMVQHPGSIVHDGSITFNRTTERLTMLNKLGYVLISDGQEWLPVAGPDVGPGNYQTTPRAWCSNLDGDSYALQDYPAGVARLGLW